MDASGDRALVYQILVQAEAYPWTMQDIGLLGLRLDERREYRLHVWDPGRAVGEPPVHDHPFDFASQVVAGEMTNTVYVEDADGTPYRRFRYAPDSDDDPRAVDTVRLAGASTTYAEGSHYAQRAHQLHDSRQLPGTVTVIRRTVRPVAELTVCLPDGTPWVSGRSRPATPEEVKEIVALALAWF
jgi:hypothetical protein